MFIELCKLNVLSDVSILSMATTFYLGTSVFKQRYEVKAVVINNLHLN